MRLSVGDFAYSIQMWQPGDDVLIGPVLALDTETELLVSGVPPLPVLLQVCEHSSRMIQLVGWRHHAAYVELLLDANPQSVLVFHNAPFDLAVLGLETDKRLQELVATGRVVDTGIRFLLAEMLRGGANMHWSLDFVAERLLGVKMDKNPEIRLTFKQDTFPSEAHLLYAAEDAAVTAQLYQQMPEALPTEQIQLLGFIALYFVSRNGMLVDQTRMQEIVTKYEEELQKHEWLLSLWGYYPGVPGCEGVLQEILSYVESDFPLKLPRTKTGKISKSDKVLQIFFVGNVPPFLRAYARSTHVRMWLSTYLQKSLIGVDGRVHPRYSPLVKTGRTSASAPNTMNLPRTEGIRGIYVPAPGNLFYACDYAQIELCALAETCVIRFGESTMADVINSGVDVHVWLGKKIMEASGGNPDDGIDYRSMAKAANFGFPGGLGWKTFQTYARGTYGVILSEQQCKDMREIWLEAFPEMYRHLKPTVDELAHGEVEDDDVDESFAAALGSDQAQAQPAQPPERFYVANTITGRVRRRATFCSACNYPLTV